mgnify:CR=1 FL=1
MGGGVVAEEGGLVARVPLKVRAERGVVVERAKPAKEPEEEEDDEAPKNPSGGKATAKGSDATAAALGLSLSPAQFMDLVKVMTAAK